MNVLIWRSPIDFGVLPRGTLGVLNIFLPLVLYSCPLLCTLRTGPILSVNSYSQEVNYFQQIYFSNAGRIAGFVQEAATKRTRDAKLEFQRGEPPAKGQCLSFRLKWNEAS